MALAIGIATSLTFNRINVKASTLDEYGYLGIEEIMYRDNSSLQNSSLQSSSLYEIPPIINEKNAITIYVSAGHGYYLSKNDAEGYVNREIELLKKEGKLTKGRERELKKIKKELLTRYGQLTPQGLFKKGVEGYSLGTQYHTNVGKIIHYTENGSIISYRDVITEEEFVLPAAKALAYELTQRGFSVINRRNMVLDKSQIRADVAHDANGKKADLFIELHANDPGAHGTRAYICPVADKKIEKIAREITRSIKQIAGSKNNKTIRRQLAVLQKTEMPAVVFEIGSLKELKNNLWNKTDWPVEFAKQVADKIDNPEVIDYLKSTKQQRALEFLKTNGRIPGLINTNQDRK